MRWFIRRAAFPEVPVLAKDGVPYGPIVTKANTENLLSNYRNIQPLQIIAVKKAKKRTS